MMVPVDSPRQAGTTRSTWETAYCANKSTGSRARCALAEPTRPTILLVDDNCASLNLLRRLLADAGYHVHTDSDGDMALAAYQAQCPDMVVLAWQAPDPNGLAVVRRIREVGTALILILMGRATVEERVAALDSGADDCLVTPYAPAEFLAHVRALVRRGPGARNTFAYADLMLDPATHKVWRGSRSIPVSPREHDLLVYLLQHPRQVLSREQLVHTVWGDNVGGDSNVLDVYISYLRKKLEAAGESRLIQTVRGVGYVLCEA
jgi:two-component system response regulator MprA